MIVAFAMENKNKLRLNKRQRVTVVYAGCELAQSPAIISLLVCLVWRFEVDLLTEYKAEVNIQGVVNHYAHKCAITIESKSILSDGLKHCIKKIPLIYHLLLRVRRSLVQAYNKINGVGQLYKRVNGSPQWGTPEFINLVAQRCVRELCDTVISVDIKELIICHLAVKEVPIVYYSVELHHREHPAFSSAHLAPLKDAEASAFKDIAAVIIQDEERARFLWNDNRRPYEPEKVILFPVSYMGLAAVKRTEYFRKLYPDLARQKLLVQMGSIKKCRRSNELIEIATRCPEQYAMIFHGFADVFAQGALEANRLPRCRLSQPVRSFGDVEEVAASADIGLVFYFDNNFNDRLIAHASSQFALFMKCGIPVLAGNVGSLSRIVRKYRCGIVVKDLANIFSAADQIMTDYETYSKNAVRCFEGEHQLRRFCKNLIDHLTELCKYPGFKL